MPSLCKEFQFRLDRHVVGVGAIDGTDALDNLIDVFFNFAFGPQMTLVVQLRIADIANIFLEVLPDAVCQRLQILIRS